MVHSCGRFIGIAASWLLASAAVAQGVPSGEAPVAVPHAIRTPDIGSPPGPAAIVDVFVQGCVLTEGVTTAAVDWALSQGFNPQDPYAPDAKPLLAGKPGTILAMGSSSSVLLASGMDGTCTVWADRAPGPAVHLAFKQALGQLAAKGAKVQSTLERNVERAGAWRRQVQVRYKRVGGTHEFGLGAVTTLGDEAGAQALRLEPVAGAAGFDPDGLPAR
jgi:hypothetical protein